MTKKEYILQYIAIGVSLLAVVASVFAGIMAYKASISSAQISGKMNKENEIETRTYDQKFNLYKEILQKLIGIYNSNSQKDDPYERAENISEYLKIQGSLVRLLGSRKVIHNYGCLIIILDKYISGGPTEDIKLKYSKEKSWIDGESWVAYDLNIIPAIYLLENSMRDELTGESLPPLSWNEDKTELNTNEICNGVNENTLFEMYILK